jgi:hypothetical protein
MEFSPPRPGGGAPAPRERRRTRESPPLGFTAQWRLDRSGCRARGRAAARLNEPWENCRDDLGPMVRIGALGANRCVTGSFDDSGTLAKARNVVRPAIPLFLSAPLV